MINLKTPAEGLAHNCTVL